MSDRHIAMRDGTAVSDDRLGRLIHFDERSRDFPIRTLLPAAAYAEPRSYTWRCGLYLNQDRGSCTGCSQTNEAAARPVVVENLAYKDALAIYARAQQIDPWVETPPEEGSSVLAAAKAAVERGWYSEYRWCFSWEDFIATVGYKGPVVVGSWWKSGMWDPDAKGFIHNSGTLEGGHAYLVNAISVREEWIFIHNSWSPWGIKRYATDPMPAGAKMSFADFEKLIFFEDGELLVPLRRHQPPVV